ncbi:CRAL-TRIO domain-containing protein [Aspergillus pseudonomiae]|uniref:CRAL-TRIO domain-containing protein n=1 Tax=Aspergillus pseudonomiae TaxID=1506151 RepID=A0A5N7D5Z9_9EURO|nr:CRAL-TRIO domain-containing protein [Aspergillus pseudonomiae]KAB8262519.1 CRAL-TRIO domain-containing protein [Aspergillus pseudonomiae]KAE8401218.1 CRAL-TRIO domain-containing protein [Aspergillus pseudonomiae]
MHSLEADPAAALASFSQLCTEQGLLKRPSKLGESDVVDGINDDTALLRFLQARAMKPHDALKQFQEATAFHAEKSVHAFYSVISVDDYEDTRRLYPHWTGRRDKQGQPITMIDLAHMKSEAMTRWRETRNLPCGDALATSSPDMAQRACVFQDGLTRFILPLCTAMTDRPDSSLPVTKTTCLVDASALSLKQAWDMRDYAQEISWILATCYPETISRIIVCNAPPSFAMIWSVVKGFVDPRTAEKLVILKSDQVYSTLEKCMDHTNIPKQFGGEFVFQNGMLPDLDEGIRQTLFWVDSKNCLPPGPLKWVQDGENRKAIATGTVGGIERAEEIAVLKKTG